MSKLVMEDEDLRNIGASVMDLYRSWTNTTLFVEMGRQVVLCVGPHLIVRPNIEDLNAVVAGVAKSVNPPARKRKTK